MVPALSMVCMQTSMAKSSQVVHGIVDDVLERIDKLDGLAPPNLVQGRIYNQSYDVSAWKIAADELALEAGVLLRFHSFAVDVLMHENGCIDAVIVETKSGRQAIRGEILSTVQAMVILRSGRAQLSASAMNTVICRTQRCCSG